MFGRVLLFSPVHPIKSYSIPLFFRAVQQLDFPKNLLTRLVISTSPKYWEFPIPEGWVKQTIDIDQTPDKYLVHRRLAAACNLARQICLDGEYDYLFSVECDVILPPYALKKLVEADKPIIEGLYYTDFDFHPPEWWIAGDVVKECTPKGTLGVCLIKREVVEKVEFRHTEAFPDAVFHHDAAELGYKSYVHCGVVCDHLTRPDGSRGWQNLENAKLLEEKE